MRIDVLTIFPEMFPPILNESMLKIAQENGRVRFYVHNLRDYSEGKRRNVDDRPYGGGPGMVMKPEPIFCAVERIEAQEPAPARRILLTPQGTRFTQQMASALAEEERLLLICGRYEGFDERVRIGLSLTEISIGDYVLCGGELPAMVIIEAVVRLIPGVLGGEQSAEADSFSKGLLDYPQYTRPEEFRGMRVPQVLLSGHHEEIAKWREEQARDRTAQRRADLLRREENTDREIVT